MIGSIPGILISSRWTVSVPQTTIRLGLGGILIISGINLLDKNKSLPSWLYASLLGALAVVVAVYTVIAMRAPAHGSPNPPNRFLNPRAVESARFAAGSLDGRAPRPAPGQRCRLRDHRAPEAHQEPDLRPAGDEDVLAGLSLRDRQGGDQLQAAASRLGHGDDRRLRRPRRRHGRHRRERAEGRLVTFRWDGRTTTGVAPNGSVYQPQVKLANDRRTILMPNKITIDTSPPKVLSASDGAGILIAGGHHGVAIRYTFGEKAHASVYVGGRRVVLGRREPAERQGQVERQGRREDAAAGPLRARGRAQSTSPGTRRRPPSGSASSSGSATSPSARRSIHVAPRRALHGQGPDGRPAVHVEVRRRARQRDEEAPPPARAGTPRPLPARRLGARPLDDRDRDRGPKK